MSSESSVADALIAIGALVIALVIGIPLAILGIEAIRDFYTAEGLTKEALWAVGGGVGMMVLGGIISGVVSDVRAARRREQEELVYVIEDEPPHGPN